MHIKWRKFGNGMLLKYDDKMFMKQRWQIIENRIQTSNEKLWWCKTERLELAQEQSWLIYAYAIRRVGKNKCRVKWTNKCWPGWNVGDVISENLERKFQMMKKDYVHCKLDKLSRIWT